MFKVRFALILLCYIVVDMTHCEEEEDDKILFCKVDSDCGDGQICLVTRCICKHGYIKNGKTCFEASAYDEPCSFDNQCYDHRQICSNTTSEVKRCVCQKDLEYDHEIGQCTVSKKIMIGLIKMETLYGTEDERVTCQNFMVCVYVPAIGLTCMAVAVIYCLRMYIQDKNLEERVRYLSLKAGTPMTTISVRTEAENKQLTEASIGPILLGDVIIG